MSGLWSDKYRPKQFSELRFHQHQAAIISNLIKHKDFPHLIFHGLSGSGRRTLIGCMLRAIYGDGIDRNKLEVISFQTPSKRTIEINAVTSSYHIMISPSEVGQMDRIVVQEIIKNMANTNQLNVGQQGKFKVIVLDDVDSLSKGAQHALRRTMEKYCSVCRLVLCCTSLSRIIPALRSRALAVRVPCPSDDQLADLLSHVAKSENVLLPSGLRSKIVKEADNNARRALLIFEACVVTEPSLTDATQVKKADWNTAIAEIATSIVQEQSPQRLLQVRDRFYELIGHLIPTVVIFQELLDNVLVVCDEQLKDAVVESFAMCECRSVKGQKPIFHLEAVTARFMCLYKEFIFENLGKMDF